MRIFKDYINKNDHVAISVPALLCFVQFVMSLFGAIRTGSFDSSTIDSGRGWL